MSDNNRDKLLKAGIELLSEKTFSEISMDQVAELSGVSKPMIYYYFNNKEGYYKALSWNLLDLARTLTSEFFRPELSLRENLVNYVRFRIDFTRENPGLAKAFLAILNDPNIGRLIDEMKDQFSQMRMEFIDPMFDIAIKKGEILPDTNRILVMMTLNSLLISCSVKILHDIPIHRDLDYEEIVDILFDGISASGKDD